MSGRHYKLVGRDVEPCSPKEWGEMYETENRSVAREEVGHVFVSTVFVGLDMRVGGEGPPLVFETTAFFPDRKDDLTERYATWAEAERGHAEMVSRFNI